MTPYFDIHPDFLVLPLCDYFVELKKGCHCRHGVMISSLSMNPKVVRHGVIAGLSFLPSSPFNETCSSPSPRHDQQHGNRPHFHGALIALAAVGTAVLRTRMAGGAGGS